MVNHILFNALQVLVVMIFSPLAIGVLNRLKEIVQSKRGPSIFQPYRDLWKLFSKDEIISEESSWIFRVTPYVVFVTPVFVTLLILVLTNYPLFWAFMADMVGAGFVLSLGGFFCHISCSGYGKPIRADGCKPHKNGWFLNRTHIYHCFFHGFTHCRFYSSIYCSGKMDNTY